MLRLESRSMLISSLLLVGVIIIAAVLATCSQPAVNADLVLLNGKVVTLDQGQPLAEAVAIHGDTILAVGTNAEIQAMIGSGTEIVYLGGQLVQPGFIESHAHFMSLGKAVMRLRLAPTRNYDEIVAMVSEAVERVDPGVWILGRGWHQEKWDRTPEINVDGLPTHHALSAVSPDNPVMLSHASGHAIMVNAKAMELAGVTSNTPDPDGGQVVRDANGDLIGIFLENAEALISRTHDRSLAERTPEQIRTEERAAIDLATQECLNKGITTFCDAGTSLDTVDIYRALADSGQLRIRLWVMLSDSTEILERRLSDYRMIGYGNNFLTVRAIKRTLDGALGSHGAWLLEPYDDLPSSFGLNTEPIDRMRAVAQLAIENDFQLCTHCIGDRANREILNIYEAVFEANPNGHDLRWRVEHVQHLQPNDISRFAQLGVVASMQGVHCTSDGPWVPKRIGAARAQSGAYVWRDLIESGALIVNGTDAPVEDVDPIACFYATVTRRLPDGSQFYPEQCMTREEALRSYTIDAAYGIFEEDIKGSITPGKLADIVVLSEDILTVPEETILDAQVVYTIVGGEIVYRSE